MSIKYACFISYRHGQHTLIEPFIDQLVEAIEGELQPYTALRCFVDKERLRGGAFYNEKLATALCQSACMITIFTPRYFEESSPYCAREYWAMEQLEAARLPSIKHRLEHEGLIIPVIPRGLGRLPRYISNRRQFFDFEAFQLGDRPLNQHPKFQQTTRTIADAIRERCEAISQETNLFDNCVSFELPPEETIREWLRDLAPEPSRLPTR